MVNTALMGVASAYVRIFRTTEVDPEQPGLPGAGIVVLATGNLFRSHDIAQRSVFDEQVRGVPVSLAQIAQLPVAPVMVLVEILL